MDFFEQLQKIDLEREWKVFTTDARKFYTSVDWSERWIVGLVALQLAQLVLVLLLRKRHAFIMGVLSFNAIVVLSAKQINEIASKRWALFSKRNYFDPNGAFVTVVLSLPLVLICLICSFVMVFQAGAMLIKLKRTQLRAQLKAASKKKK